MWREPRDGKNNVFIVCHVTGLFPISDYTDYATTDATEKMDFFTFFFGNYSVSSSSAGGPRPPVSSSSLLARINHTCSINALVDSWLCGQRLQHLLPACCCGQDHMMPMG